MEQFSIIFCIVMLSVTLVIARPQDLLGEGLDYQYGIDLSKLEDELIDQAAVVDDKLFLQHLLSKWKTSTTTTNYPVEESSTETTTPNTTPATTTTTTTEPTTTTTTTTTEASTTTATNTPPPTPAAATFTTDLTNRRNPLFPYENTNIIPIGAYSAHAYQPPSYSYYPVSHYNMMPPQMPQMPQNLPGLHGMTHMSGVPQPMPGLHAVPHMSAAISQFPQTMFSMPGTSPLQAYNPYAQYPMQFISPVYSPYRHFKK